MKKKEKPLIGISACLLGEVVRYNKGNKEDQWLTKELGKYIDFYPFCPEVEMGLGVPREEIHLVYSEKDKNDIRLKSKFSKVDLTDLAKSTFTHMNERMNKVDLDGIILMRKSPSCGLNNIKTVRDDEKGPVRMLQGLYAANIEKNYPLIPTEDNGRIKGSLLRELFVKNVFAHFRLHQIKDSISELQDFHRRYKYILMEHSQAGLKSLGKIVANHEKKPFKDILKEYEILFHTIMNKKPSIKNRFNTLMHIMGYFKEFLTKEEKSHILELLNDYKNDHETYMVPLNLLKFFVKKYKVDYLKDHYYFNPYPKELKIHKTI